MTDAVILSGMVDFTLLAARHKVIEQQALLYAYGVLRSQADNNNIGIVINAAQKTAGAHYPAYGYGDSEVRSQYVRS